MILYINLFYLILKLYEFPLTLIIAFIGFPELVISSETSLIKKYFKVSNGSILYKFVYVLMFPPSASSAAGGSARQDFLPPCPHRR